MWQTHVCNDLCEPNTRRTATNPAVYRQLAPVNLPLNTCAAASRRIGGHSCVVPPGDDGSEAACRSNTNTASTSRSLICGDGFCGLATRTLPQTSPLDPTA